MPFLLLTIVAVLCLGGPAAAQTNSVYLDEAAREHVRKARERRQIADLSIDAYKALSKERLSVGLRGIRRDRLMYRREVAGRIEWTREGPARVEVLGAREAVPIAMKGVQLPGDLTHYMPHLAFDPADPNLLFWDDDSFVRHPLSPDAEEHYKFRTGGTTTIRLQDGRTIRLIELEIIPQRSDPHLIIGSFWLDAETHAVVQAAFRLARSIDILRDIEEEDDPDDQPPKWLGKMTADLDYVTIEYGLYELKWWMPRLMAFEGGVRVGPLRMPLLYERSYAQYEITGREIPETISIAELIQRDSVRRKQEDPCQHRMQVSVGENRETTDTLPNRQVGRCGRWEIVMSTDTAALLNSPLLPDNVYSGDEELLTEADIEQLKERIEGLPRVPTMLGAPELSYSFFDPGMLRYNRIEGLSLGSSASVDFGPYIINGEARIGLADLQPNFELNIQRPGDDATLTLGAYRRLNSTDPWRRPFTIGSSLTSLLFGRDDSDFYRTLGVELRGEPAGPTGGAFSWRVYAQTEREAKVETEFSVRHLLDNDYTFTPNIIADDNDAVGGEVMVRFQRGLNPTGFRFGAELYGHGSTGTYDFGRAAVTLRFGIPLPGALDMATEYAAGATLETAPLQHNWYIGGTGTVRGYHAGEMIGETFWRARAEIGFGLPAFRLVAFSDAGWAGQRDEFSRGKPLLSVGAGLSFLDGIVRLDVARGLREPKGWAAVLYFDGAL